MKIFVIIFYLIIAISLIAIIGKLYQYLKSLYVLINIDNVSKLGIHPYIQTYKEVWEKRGVSVGLYHTTHYRIKRIPDRKIWKATAYFKNGKCLNFRIKENSKLYYKIVCRIKL